uniref:non-specific serine/threonine protein kinase n=1 Tax=Anopheles culicifacies TaxID=139723 RepID=A0A182LTF7_9DIPT
MKAHIYMRSPVCNWGAMDIKGYTVEKIIGFGGCGRVYHGICKRTKKPVAIKVELPILPISSLSNEFQIYAALAGGSGIPEVYSFDERGHSDVLVMELLGPSLQDKFHYCNNRFSLKTVLLLADQMLARLEYIHQKNIIHRDIKPSNFVMGLAERQRDVYLIDFGLAMNCSSNGYQFTPPCVGTETFMSINAHKEAKQGRRDDLESLGYVMLYFLRGSLPWHGKFDRYMDSSVRVMEKKLSTSIEELCDGFPVEFDRYLTYCRGLGLEEIPCYEKLRHSFSQLYHQLNYEDDNLYDWVALEELGDVD